MIRAPTINGVDISCLSVTEWDYTTEELTEMVSEARAQSDLVIVMIHWGEEKGYDRVDPWLFISYYDANGWKIGKTPMVNWESALDVWAMREMRRPAKKNSGYANRTIRMEDIDIVDLTKEDA